MPVRYLFVLRLNQGIKSVFWPKVLWSLISSWKLQTSLTSLGMLHATYRNTTTGRDASSGDYNDFLWAGKNIRDILQLAAILFANLTNGHGVGRRRSRNCRCGWPRRWPLSNEEVPRCWSVIIIFLMVRVGPAVNWIWKEQTKPVNVDILNARETRKLSVHVRRHLIWDGLDAVLNGILLIGNFQNDLICSFLCLECLPKCALAFKPSIK